MNKGFGTNMARLNLGMAEHGPGWLLSQHQGLTPDAKEFSL